MEVYALVTENDYGDNSIELYRTRKGAKKAFDKEVKDYRKNLGRNIEDYESLEDFDENMGITVTENYLDNGEGYQVFIEVIEVQE